MLRRAGRKKSCGVKAPGKAAFSEPFPEQTNRGSSMVEAAIVYPAAILIVALIIMKGMSLYADVKSAASVHIEEIENVSGLSEQ